MRGNWAFDVSYTIATSLTVADRRDWERELLAFYLEKLAAAGGTAPDFDAAWLSYRQQMYWSYFGWLLSIGRSAIQPKFHPTRPASASWSAPRTPSWTSTRSARSRGRSVTTHPTGRGPTPLAPLHVGSAPLMVPLQPPGSERGREGIRWESGTAPQR
jgi:hypothetical protein